MPPHVVSSEHSKTSSSARPGCGLPRLSTELEQKLRRSVEKIDAVPTMPSILRPLLKYIECPVEEIEMQRVVEMVACDESLAAQCIRIANSPLYGRLSNVSTIRGAVLALGMRRLRDLLLSCCLVRLSPNAHGFADPVPFWQHAFGCALVSRHFAQKIGFPDPEKAYLAGLLHDVGELVTAMYMSEDFEKASKMVEQSNCSYYDAELATLGYSHCETGHLLAEHWSLPGELSNVIQWHHDPEQAKSDVSLTALVSISDLLCATRGLDYGVRSPSQEELIHSPGWRILNEEYPYLARVDFEKFSQEIDEFTGEVTHLVGSLFGR